MDDKRERLQRHIEEELKQQLVLPFDDVERQLAFEFVRLTQPVERADGRS
jgi:hypothetical protein